MNSRLEQDWANASIATRAAVMGRPELHWYLVVRVLYENPQGVEFQTNFCGILIRTGANLEIKEIPGDAYNKRT